MASNLLSLAVLAVCPCTGYGSLLLVEHAIIFVVIRRPASPESAVATMEGIGEERD